MIMRKGDELFRTITTTREEMSDLQTSVGSGRCQIRQIHGTATDSMVYYQITKQLRAHFMFRRGADYQLKLKYSTVATNGNNCQASPQAPPLVGG